MRELPENSVDSVVCDPPYFLSFMNRAWDTSPTPKQQQEQHEAWAREALRVLRPGGFLLAFGGTRTVHRLACAIEDAGFEIRDRILHLRGGGAVESSPGEVAWVYGSG
jgi:site-specific DNA-methyltransferase (adenine-specific)